MELRSSALSFGYPGIVLTGFLLFGFLMNSMYHSASECSLWTWSSFGPPDALRAYTDFCVSRRWNVICLRRQSSFEENREVV